MSGAFDKKTEKARRREEQTLKEQRERRKIKIITIVVIVAFALALSVSLFLNSMFVRQSLPAISVAGIDFSSAEFDYFYSKAFSDYEQYIKERLGESSAAAFLPSSDRSHSSQTYNYETGETWAEFLTEYAIDQIADSAKYYHAARAAGFTLPPEAIEAIDEEMAAYASYAEMYGMSTDTFIRTYIGRNMSESSIRKTLEFMYTVSAYRESIYDSFTYTAQELAAKYAEEKDDLDSFAFRFFQIEPAMDSMENFETGEDYEAANAEALSAAYERARQIVARIETEDDFIYEAAAYNFEEYGSPDSTARTFPGSALGSEYKDWMLSEGRQYNDIDVFEASTGALIVYFVERDDNEYLMTEMRQILIMPEEVYPGMFIEEEDDPEYHAALYDADLSALELAETARIAFIEAGGTEEAFIQISNEGYSDDTTGGHYNYISKNAANNKMVPEIEEWLFDPGRAIGDTEIGRAHV